jgi:hypothetical protein
VQNVFVMIAWRADGLFISCTGNTMPGSIWIGCIRTISQASLFCFVCFKHEPARN